MNNKFICGKNSVIEAFENKVPIKTVYILAQNSIKLPKDIKTSIVSKQELDKMTEYANHQGIAAEMVEFNYYDLITIEKDRPEVILVLDHIQDIHNLGAIIRTANANGIFHLILPKDRAAMITPTVLKVASGGAVGLKITRSNSLFDSVKKLKEAGYWIYATALEAKAKTVNEVVFNKPAIIIVGNEQTGVSSTLLKIADEKVYIPMKGTVQSLNVSVATGIVLFALNK